MSSELVAVVDVGSASTKAGFSAHDVPESVFPSALSKWSRGTESMDFNPETSPVVESTSILASAKDPSRRPLHPVRRGVVKDWDQMQTLWQMMIEEIGIPSPENTSIMLIESPRAKPSDRAKWANLLFETYRAPSICFGNSASMCVFAAGRTTGVAVDCGSGLTSAVPVFEGLALTHAAICMDYGGLDITSQLWSQMKEKGVQLSFDDARKVKEAMCFAPTGGHSIPPPQASGDNKVTVSLPDGTDVDIDGRVFSESSNTLFHNERLFPKGLVSQVFESIKLCDDSIRRSMLNNVILAGGTSMMKGFGDRLAWDLNAKLILESTKQYNSSDLRVVPNSYYRESGYTNQRKHAAWIGGSIFSSLDTYKDLKITRQEWEENAEAILQTKCY